MLCVESVKEKGTHTYIVKGIYRYSNNLLGKKIANVIITIKFALSLNILFRITSKTNIPVLIFKRY